MEASCFLCSMICCSSVFSGWSREDSSSSVFLVVLTVVEAGFIGLRLLRSGWLGYVVRLNKPALGTVQLKNKSIRAIIYLRGVLNSEPLFRFFCDACAIELRHAMECGLSLQD